MARPRAYDDQLKERLLDVTSRLLTEEGPYSLSTRRIAAEAGTSTTAIYSLIGSKEALLREVYLEGFRRLADHMAEVPVDADPLARLRALGVAYLDNAVANPHLYRVMFNAPMPEFEPTDADVEFSLSTLQTLIDGVQDCVEAGVLVGDVEDLAVELWAVGHGVASLVVAGMIDADRARRLHDHVMTATCAGFMAAPAGRGSTRRPGGPSRSRPSARDAIDLG